MPITRRRRANPPDQPENNNHQSVDQTENAAEALAAEQTPIVPEAEAPGGTGAPAVNRMESSTYPLNQVVPPAPTGNGERIERNERIERAERQEYAPTPIEGGRRTARGEIFRRPPQPPAQPMAPASVTSAPLQPPSHEIGLPLGNLLHLAYNPGYTGADEARSALLHQLANESKSGGRARCWSCGSLAIVYDCWNTRSRTFGEVGVAICEICGVWSVM
ncbi:hypothetical protein EPA93_40420 [Ktedonosporobacter rubrisoli]|uniref:Uncharacterized protein n=1 Tax=Ktedonosporobacter rubrisoli TaxID=2509675 RepID=A0A4P6K2H8_KTERU|nr:hypothetical protein [Ktedonosporobacter rubrisoli]QBD81910.1 hypothetical protein EPA93_40420 [Ktedonosporobacter rubrisoli]